ncbi:MAG: hypothetical protein Q8P77_03635, partial [Candidatus Veblenbacteria bacterium]|nr:hypothetical protein [Candidatus Veblenbacteria bacterium]
MPLNHQDILQELYALAPELKAREAELAPLVAELLALTPQVEPNPAFVQELKLKLTNHAHSLAATKPAASSTSIFMTILSFIRAPYLLTSLTAAAIVLLVVTALPGALRRSGSSSPFVASITRLPAGAFGSLAVATGSLTAPQGLGAGADKMAASPQAPLAALGMPATEFGSATSLNESAYSSVATTTPAGLGGGSAGRLMYPYPYPGFTYRYAGEPVTDLPASVDVLKRLKNVGFPAPSDFLSSFDLGNFNLGSFSGASLSQLALTEDREFGYVINIDFMEGTVNVSENWRRWPQPFNDCQDDACYKRLQLTPQSMPDDATLTALANDFLKDHGISRANYGEPFVQNEWRVMYERTADTSLVYVPDVVTVMYPLVVKGAPVYEFGGMQVGLGVNVNVRYNRVSGLWNLTSQSYQASQYEAETDFDTLVKYATSNSQGGYPMPLMAEKPPVDAPQVSGRPETPPTDDVPAPTQLELGTPTRGYLRYWQYVNNDSQELLLPALVFPVLNASEQENYYGAKSVVVPLVKE